MKALQDQTASTTATVSSPHGEAERLMVVDEETLMELIRDNGLPLLASCGGQLSCATCHVYIADDWVDRLPTPSEEELDLLKGCENYDERCSRLSCQIALSADIDGIVAAIAPEG